MIGAGVDVENRVSVQVALSWGGDILLAHTSLVGGIQPLVK